MKKFLKFSFILFLVPTLFFTSCKETEVEDLVDPASTILQTYMTANGYDMGSIISYTDDAGDAIKFVAGAPAEAADVAAFVAKYYIMDIRSADSFNAGHISGAKNVAFANILTESESAGDKPILVVCYTGQTACYATSLLRMYGLRNTQALKWGMSGWSITTDSWTSSVANEADGHANWSYGAAPAVQVYELPDFTLNVTDGAAILKSRVEDAVAAGFKTALATDVLNTPSNYFINNYFSATDYDGFGHVDGAYRILDDFSVTNLDPTAKVVTYCYTGQTSAVITAFLNVMGYDAYSLKFGMNGLWNQNPAWVSNKWVSTNSKDYDLVQ